MTNLGAECFGHCYSLKSVTCEIPTAIEGIFFTYSPIEKATLYVPETSLESYRTTSDWNKFGTFQTIQSTGIDNNSAGKFEATDAIYNLDGKRNKGTVRGLNILRMTDGTTRKVMK